MPRMLSDGYIAGFRAGLAGRPRRYQNPEGAFDAMPDEIDHEASVELISFLEAKLTKQADFDRALQLLEKVAPGSVGEMSEEEPDRETEASGYHQPPYFKGMPVVGKGPLDRRRAHDRRLAADHALKQLSRGAASFAEMFPSAMRIKPEY